MKQNHSLVQEKIKESALSVLPILLIVSLLCLFVSPLSPDLLLSFLLGSVLIIVGMGIFTLGAETSMTPIGNRIGTSLTKSRNLPLIRRAVERHGLAGAVPGIHLEGPFLARGAIGSHNPEWVQAPSPETVERLYQQAEGFVRLITVSADAPGAPEAIARARKLGIAVSVGHHLANTADIVNAADAGAQALTHLGNGLPNQLDRHRNPIWAGLAEDRLSAMIITDGHHLPADLIKVILRVKGADRVIVTSDASEAAGYPPGHCRVLGNDAILTPDGKLYNPAKNCLVAAAVTLDFCMKHLASLELLSDAELLKVGRTNALRLIGSTPECMETTRQENTSAT